MKEYIKDSARIVIPALLGASMAIGYMEYLKDRTPPVVSVVDYTARASIQDALDKVAMSNEKVNRLSASMFIFDRRQRVIEEFLRGGK